MYHGIIVEQSLNGDVRSEDLFKVINMKLDDDWVIKLVEINSNDIIKELEKLQDVMDDGAWYNHFYNNNNELIVVFKDRMFKVNNDKDSFNEIIEYGLSKDIDIKQLDFYPNNFVNEIEYFKGDE